MVQGYSYVLFLIALKADQNMLRYKYESNVNNHMYDRTNHPMNHNLRLPVRNLTTQCAPVTPQEFPIRVTTTITPKLHIITTEQHVAKNLQKMLHYAQEQTNTTPSKVDITTCRKGPYDVIYGLDHNMYSNGCRIRHHLLPMNTLAHSLNSITNKNNNDNTTYNPNYTTIIPTDWLFLFTHAHNFRQAYSLLARYRTDEKIDDRTLILLSLATDYSYDIEHQMDPIDYSDLKYGLGHVLYGKNGLRRQIDEMMYFERIDTKFFRHMNTLPNNQTLEHVPSATFKVNIRPYGL